jgi:hydrogenase expression/formation protein HypC
MCLVSPAQVVALDGAVATLEIDGRRRLASILLEPDVAVGDWVIVAGGQVLRLVDPSAASEMLEAVDLVAGAVRRPSTHSRGATGE